jgi:hypothetical protein
MSSPSPQRSVKIDQDERGGWSSDRPRREGAPARPADVGVRCRVLAPTDRLRYTPSSLVVIVCATAAERDRFTQRVLEDRGALLSLERVRGLLQGRVAADELDARAGELLEAAAVKRLQAGESVVIAADGVDADERERYVRMAARFRRPRHLVLVETAREQVQEDDRGPLNDLRRALDAGELGAEGFHTALRLGGASVAELKRIVFRPAPQED